MEVAELRKYAKEITKEMEKRKFSYQDADMFVVVLKDEIKQCREAENIKIITALN
ncbi:MAG: hypothetical protein HFG29_10160 [Eubacterium sp.]|nr:hypothetical protein [Eubacterium sp.]